MQCFPTREKRWDLGFRADGQLLAFQGGAKDFNPAPKYGGSATQVTNLAAANPAAAQHLASVAAQTPLQVRTKQTNCCKALVTLSGSLITASALAKPYSCILC